ncbi:hypothetical protein MMC07_000225 [Pseudocyphellaria aurata]|nr:hypothetical protein [Pseudocyphellaria aurata]
MNDPSTPTQLDRLVRRTAGHTSDSTRLQITRALLGANLADNLDLVCYHHARMLATRWGLQTGSIDEKELKRRLLCLWNAQNNLHALRTGPGTYWWFRQNDRPTVPSNLLGVAKYAPSIPQPTGVSDLVVSAILAETTGLDYAGQTHVSFTKAEGMNSSEL